MPREAQFIQRLAGQIDFQNEKVGQDLQNLLDFSAALSRHYYNLMGADGSKQVPEEVAAEANQAGGLSLLIREMVENITDVAKADAKTADIVSGKVQEDLEKAKEAQQKASEKAAETAKKFGQAFAQFSKKYPSLTSDDAGRAVGILHRSYLTQSKLSAQLNARKEQENQNDRLRLRRGFEIENEMAGEKPEEGPEEEAEEEPLEKAQIVSPEKLKNLGVDKAGRLETRSWATQQSLRFRAVASQLRRMVGTDARSNGENQGIVSHPKDRKDFLNVAQQLEDYSKALDTLTTSSLDSQKAKESLETLSTMPDFLGRRSGYRQVTNYEIMSDIYNSNLTGLNQQDLDEGLENLGFALEMDMHLEQLHPGYIAPKSREILQRVDHVQKELLETAVLSSEPEIDLSRALAERKLKAENPGREPSWAEIKKEGKSFLKLPMFKQLTKSPERMQSYLKNQNYTDLVQKMNAPFMEGSVEKKREVLEKLKMFSQNRQLMDGPEGRSDKWKNLLSSMQEIDTSKPETYDRQLEKVFGHTEAYMKGKKTKSSDDGIDRRFEQCLDILGIVAETSDFARDRANILVDRTNHVRTRWMRSQPTVSIEVGSRDAVKQIDSQHAQLMKAKKDPVALEDIKGDAAYDDYTLVGEVEQISESRKASRNLSMVSNI